MYRAAEARRLKLVGRRRRAPLAAARRRRWSPAPLRLAPLRQQAGHNFRPKLSSCSAYKGHWKRGGQGNKVGRVAERSSAPPAARRRRRRLPHESMSAPRTPTPTHVVLLVDVAARHVVHRPDGGEHAGNHLRHGQEMVVRPRAEGALLTTATHRYPLPRTQNKEGSLMPRMRPVPSPFMRSSTCQKKGSVRVGATAATSSWCVPSTAPAPRAARQAGSRTPAHQRKGGVRRQQGGQGHCSCRGLLCQVLLLRAANHGADCGRGGRRERRRVSRVQSADRGPSGPPAPFTNAGQRLRKCRRRQQAAERASGLTRLLAGHGGLCRAGEGAGRRPASATDTHAQLRRAGGLQDWRGAPALPHSLATRRGAVQDRAAVACILAVPG